VARETIIAPLVNQHSDTAQEAHPAHLPVVLDKVPLHLLATSIQPEHVVDQLDSSAPLATAVRSTDTAAVEPNIVDNHTTCIMWLKE
jgi:hypothetical protein